MNAKTEWAGSELDEVLGRIERALNQAMARLRRGDVDRLPADCQALQQALQDRSLQLHLRTPLDSGSALRLQNIAAGLTQMRQALARSGAAVQRQLQVLLPTASLPTYARQASAWASNRSAAATSLCA